MKLKEIFEDEVLFAIVAVILIAIVLLIIEAIGRYLSEVHYPFTF